MISSSKAEILWFVLPKKGQRRLGPYTFSELREVLAEHRAAQGLKLRNSGRNVWVPLGEAGAIYPELVSAGLVERPENADEICNNYKERETEQRHRQATSATANASKRSPLTDLVIDGLKGFAILVALVGSFTWKGAVTHDSLVSGIAGPFYLFLVGLRSIFITVEKGVVGFEQAWDETWRAGTGLYKMGFVVGVLLIVSAPRYVGAFLALLKYIGKKFEED